MLGSWSKITAWTCVDQNRDVNVIKNRCDLISVINGITNPDIHLIGSVDILKVENNSFVTKGTRFKIFIV